MTSPSGNSPYRWYRALRNECGLRLFARRMRKPFPVSDLPAPHAATELQTPVFQLRNSYRVQQGKRSSAGKYIISADINDLYSGLGCSLLVLAPCWKYALTTGRTLIVDWRGNPYTRKDPRTNLFSLLFEPPDPSELGVACIADDSINDLQLPQPILGPRGVITQESGISEAFPGEGIDVGLMRRILASGVDVDFPTVLPSLGSTYFLATNFGPSGGRKPAMMSFGEARRLYKSLKLRPQWAATLAAFHENHMAGRPVLGVHVRLGNGEGRYRDHFRQRDVRPLDFITGPLAERIRRYARERFGANYTVFLCTDSDEVVGALQSCFDSLVSRSIWRPAPGEGIDFDHAYKRPDGGLGAAVDALLDMQLLAKCDAVFMTSQTAFASHVPFILEKPGAVFFDNKQTVNV